MFKVFDSEQAGLSPRCTHTNAVWSTSAHARFCFSWASCQTAVCHVWSLFAAPKCSSVTWQWWGGLSLSYPALKSFVMSSSAQDDSSRGNVSKLVFEELAVWSCDAARGHRLSCGARLMSRKAKCQGYNFLSLKVQKRSFHLERWASDSSRCIQIRKHNWCTRRQSLWIPASQLPHSSHSTTPSMHRHKNVVAPQT